MTAAVRIAYVACLVAASGGSPVMPRFRIVSECEFPIWIQSQYGAHGLPIPGVENAKKLLRGESQDFKIPDEGLAGSRFWAKTGCDSSGYKWVYCVIICIIIPLILFLSQLCDGRSGSEPDHRQMSS